MSATQETPRTPPTVVDTPSSSLPVAEDGAGCVATQPMDVVDSQPDTESPRCLFPPESTEAPVPTSLTYVDDFGQTQTTVFLKRGSHVVLTQVQAPADAAFTREMSNLDPVTPSLTYVDDFGQTQTGVLLKIATVASPSKKRSRSRSPSVEPSPKRPRVDDEKDVPTIAATAEDTPVNLPVISEPVALSE